MSTSEIIVYGAMWCGDCRRTRRFLDKNQIPYVWINIDEDKQSEAFVYKVNQGTRSIPTIVFPDGSILVEPSNSILAQKLGVFSL
jgi:glutaredoxin-like protein